MTLCTTDADVSIVGTHAAKKAADLVLQGQFGHYRAHSLAARKSLQSMRFASGVHVYTCMCHFHSRIL